MACANGGRRGLICCRAGLVRPWQSHVLLKGGHKAVRDFKWSGSEKQIARRAYEAAAQALLDSTVADFKARALAVATPEEMWALEDHLRQERRKIDDILDYRYSHLPMVFARLIHDGWLDEGQLAGLSDEKLEMVRRCLSFAREHA